MPLQPGQRTSPKRITVVIAGGGVQCAVGLGLAQVLAREGLAIHQLVGCNSHGAGGGGLFAALMALSLPTAQVTDWIPKLWTHHLTRQRDERATLLAMLHQRSHTPTRPGAGPNQSHDAAAREHAQALQQLFGDMRMENTATPLMITAADTRGHTCTRPGAQAVFTQGRLADVLLASHARPFVLQPWMHDGSQYTHGAWPASDAVLVLGGLDGGAEDGATDGTLQQTALYLDGLMGQSRPHAHAAPLRLQAPHGLQQAAQQGLVIAVTPVFAEPVGSFDYAKIPSIVAQGERAAVAILPQLHALLNTPRRTGLAPANASSATHRASPPSLKEKVASTHSGYA